MDGVKARFEARAWIQVVWDAVAQGARLDGRPPAGLWRRHAVWGCVHGWVGTQLCTEPLGQGWQSALSGRSTFDNEHGVCSVYLVRVAAVWAVATLLDAHP